MPVATAEEARSPALRVAVLGAYVFLAGGLVQFFLAGLGVFEAASFDPHAILGYVLVVVAVVVAVAAGLARTRVRLALALLVLALVQTGLPQLEDSAPVIAALHPVNALALLATAHFVAHGLPSGRRAASGTPAS